MSDPLAGVGMLSMTPETPADQEEADANRRYFEDLARQQGAAAVATQINIAARHAGMANLFQAFAELVVAITERLKS